MNGSIYMGNGSDTVTINGLSLATIPVLDGGDDVSIADGYIDRLQISNAGTVSFGSSSLTNWEKITLDATN